MDEKEIVSLESFLYEIGITEKECKRYEAQAKLIAELLFDIRWQRRRVENIYLSTTGGDTRSCSIDVDLVQVRNLPEFDSEAFDGGYFIPLAWMNRDFLIDFDLSLNSKITSLATRGISHIIQFIIVYSMLCEEKLFSQIEMLQLWKFCDTHPVTQIVPEKIREYLDLSKSFKRFTGPLQFNNRPLWREVLLIGDVEVKEKISYFLFQISMSYLPIVYFNEQRLQNFNSCILKYKMRVRPSLGYFKDSKSKTELLLKGPHTDPISIMMSKYPEASNEHLHIFAPEGIVFASPIGAFTENEENAEIIARTTTTSGTLEALSISRTKLTHNYNRFLDDYNVSFLIYPKSEIWNNFIFSIFISLFTYVLLIALFASKNRFWYLDNNCYNSNLNLDITRIGATFVLLGSGLFSLFASIRNKNTLVAQRTSNSILSLYNLVLVTAVANSLTSILTIYLLSPDSVTMLLTAWIISAVLSFIVLIFFLVMIVNNSRYSKVFSLLNGYEYEIEVRPPRFRKAK